MSVTSGNPTSRRGYLSRSELAEFANITITDSTEADDKISQAEEMVDQYVGVQKKFMPEQIVGRATAGGSTSLTLQSNQQNIYDVDYFKLCEVEILGGTGAGQRKKITGSTKAGVLTVDSAWSTTPSTDSFYTIYQLGKFPRVCDVNFYSEQSPSTYYKQIPEAIKRAVAAQVEYFIEMGDGFFAGDKVDMDSESIGDYSYSKGKGAGAFSKQIAPKVRLLLKGIVNRVGELIAD